MNIECLETIPVTDTERGCSAPAHQPKTLWVVLSLFWQYPPLEADTVSEPGGGVGWRSCPGYDSQGTTQIPSYVS